MGLQISDELITPELAKQYLENQQSNRSISNSYIKRMASDIINNRWLDEADPIKFSADGRLVDGQHRLSAVIKADKPQKFVVIRGYSKDSMAVLDMGKARSAAHIGQIIGLGINQTHTSCINSLQLPFWGEAFSNPRILELFNLYNLGVVFACQNIPDTNLRPTAPMRALIAKAYYYEDPEVLQEFMYVFSSGYQNNPPHDSAAVTLRNHWKQMKEDGELTIGDKKRMEWYLKCQNALSYFIKGLDTRKLAKARNIVDHYPLPEIQKKTEDNLKRFKALRNI